MSGTITAPYSVDPQATWATSTTLGAHGVHLRFDQCSTCEAKDAAFRRLWFAFLILCCQVVAIAAGFVVVVAHG